MTIQGPPGNNSYHPEPIRGNGNASRAHQVPFATPLPVDHLLGKLFKYLTQCGRGARAVRILPQMVDVQGRGSPESWASPTTYLLMNTQKVANNNAFSACRFGTVNRSSMTANKRQH